MCGIVGGVGQIDFREYLIKGLKKLDYRGYDSAGIALLDRKRLFVKKMPGKVEELGAALPETLSGTVGIAHTRWATHGEPNERNAHPHISLKRKFALVHNGVIENFKALKKDLSKHGYGFLSDTDSEVVVDLLEYNYHGDVLQAIEKTMGQLVGSYACAIIHADEPNRLYFMKNASPLLLGKGEGANYLASDAGAMIGLTESFVDLEDGDYGYLEPEAYAIFSSSHPVERPIVARSKDFYDDDLHGYPHYMIKEIHEIPSVLRRLLDNYLDDGFVFDKNMLSMIKMASSVHFLACGTSFYASKVGVKYFRSIGKRSGASIASEWAYDPYDIGENPFFIILSQSGETADLIKCQKVINDNNLPNLVVTNSKGSTLERKATFSSLLYAGVEVAVASTKSYLAQIAYLALLVAALKGDKNVEGDIRTLISSIEEILADDSKIKKLAYERKAATDAFYVGRGYDYLAALEGALKMKEVAYVHAESYPGGELKHGPIALIQKGTLVIGYISDAEKEASSRNNFVELASRGADILVVSDEKYHREGDLLSFPSVPEYLGVGPAVVISQLLAYYLAEAKGLPIDKPRNLAKSVTVE